MRRSAAILVLVVGLSGSAQAAGEESVTSEGGAGAGAAIVTLIYAPLKLAYALGGVVLSGVTWLWTGGNSDVAKSVARTATDGDYVITPSHLQRQNDVAFTGDS